MAYRHQLNRNFAVGDVHIINFNLHYQTPKYAFVCIKVTRIFFTFCTVSTWKVYSPSRSVSHVEPATSRLMIFESTPFRVSATVLLPVFVVIVMTSPFCKSPLTDLLRVV